MDTRKEKIQYISNKIKDLRIKLGWSQNDLAIKAGVTGAAISQIEKGDRLPSLIVGGKIADAFQIPLSELMGDTVPNFSTMSDEVQTFFRKYSDIENLSENDKEMIKSLIERLKNNV